MTVPGNNSEFERVGDDVARLLGEPPAIARAAGERAIRRRLELRQARRRRLKWLSWGGGGVAALAAAGLATLFLLPPTPSTVPGPVEVRVGDAPLAEGGWLRAPRQEQLRVDFEDASVVDVAAKARVRLARASGKEVRLDLESGRLQARITPKTRLKWTFRAGPYRVRVTGTQLGLHWRAGRGQFVVDVTEGSVSVWGGHIAGSLSVSAGQQLRADVEQSEAWVGPAAAQGQDSAAVESSDAGLAQPRADVQPATRSRRPKGPGVAPAALRRWKQLAEGGEYKAAADAARGIGIRRLVQALSGEDLLLLADTLRFSGHLRQARAALVGLRRRYSGSQSAQIAAFRLGRLAFDQQHDYSAASRWFRRFVKEAPESPLVADARGRLMVALQRSGELTAARLVAGEYLARHAGGAYAATAAAILQGGQANGSAPE